MSNRISYERYIFVPLRGCIHVMIKCMFQVCVTVIQCYQWAPYFIWSGHALYSDILLCNCPVLHTVKCSLVVTVAENGRCLEFTNNIHIILSQAFHVCGEYITNNWPCYKKITPYCFIWGFFRNHYTCCVSVSIALSTLPMHAKRQLLKKHANWCSKSLYQQVLYHEGPDSI